MKFTKLIAFVCVLAVAAMIVPSANATTPTVVMAGAGSSAVFNAAYDAAKSSGQCGTNLWTHGSGTYPPPFTAGGTLHDVRNAGIPDDNSNIWVSFDGTAGASFTDTTVICLYISVDSGVGVRGFLASPRAQLILSDAPGDAAQSKVNGYTDNVATLPVAIWNDINVLATCGGTTNTTGCGSVVGTTMNVAFSDIRPEDAQYATFRALGANSRNCAPNNPYTNACCYFNSVNLGYGNWPSAYDAGPSPVLSGTAIKSSFSATVATPTYFEQVPGIHDGYTGQPVLNYATYPVGAIPVLILVSNADSSAGGFGAGVPGNYSAKNVDLYTAAYIFDGVLTRTQDITGLAGSTPIEQIQREPLSGTYNTFEFNLTRTHAIQNSQEDGVYPANPGNYNPLSYKAGDNALRFRAIGTGEMIKAINGLAPSFVTNGNTTALANRIGYAFWSYGNVLPLANATCGSTISGTFPITASVTCTTNPTGHYLTVNGVDPLFNTPADNPQGPLNPPTCGSPAFSTLPCPTIPFTHIDDGSYPMWTIVRMITDGATVIDNTTPLGKIYNTIVTTSATKFFDFEEFANLSVFRMHRGASWGAQGNPNAFFNPVNGTVCAAPFPAHSASFTGQDMGSDVGGGVITIKADLDFALDYQGASPGSAFCGVPGGAFIGQTGQVE